ncbi:aminoglycoside N(3)-acetyltransferase [Paenibacillus protaetiae]|uniref:Aminoglycoside N(3)-acetyltransferase n=1 Tax=Paenibacillus protaetiae TaxID=2509456 RepID=A0A4P6EZE8_9BACL|nr:AAC(3) family N-acetyltransferase [Paenibacillus protaetiae]QAY67673.1 AAC(3) family N-acetyltransferase [Paenibacillus protaetiae]
MEQLKGKLMTVRTLAEDFRRLGMCPGMTVIVHSSFKSIGSWVLGGPVSVILALEEVLGPEGTLVMPAHSTDLSDPAGWQNPPVDPAWWDVIRENMPPYDRDLTPTNRMGIIAELFRKQNGVLRSAHPQLSFAARGKHAGMVTDNHSYEYGLGENSPLARIYELDGHVLLLGVDNGNNTSIHLAECRSSYPSKQETAAYAPVVANGQRQWIGYADLAYDSSDFSRIGEDFERDTGLVKRGLIGQSSALLLPQRAVVDYAVEWMKRNRKS